MSRYIKIDDIRNALPDLYKRVFLEKRTAEYILKALRYLPTIDIVHCGECSNRKKNKFCLEHERYEKNDESFCSYGERIEK